jgi:hypothetical protein
MVLLLYELAARRWLTPYLADALTLETFLRAKAPENL